MRRNSSHGDRPSAAAPAANLERLLAERLRTAFADVAGAPADPRLRRSRRADFQADGAFAVARHLDRDPREVAGHVLRQARLADLCSAAGVGGPGFINLVVSPELLRARLAETAGDERLGIPRATEPDTVVIDYATPIVTRTLPAGQLRTVTIADATTRLLEWRGDTVIRESRIGVWGTPFGLLVGNLADIGEAEAAHDLALGRIGTFRDSARRRALLDGSDDATRRLRELLASRSLTHFAALYERLGMRLTTADFVGGGSCAGQLSVLADDLAQLGLLQLSDGAACVFPPGFTNRHGDPLPIIVRKHDGGFGYGAADLAALRHQIRDLRATRVLYVAGIPQGQHVRMVFVAARRAGWLPPAVRAEHVACGSATAEEGRMLADGSGAPTGLPDLLDEVVSAAAALLRAHSQGSDAEQAAVARMVGIGAVRYCDLSADRTRNYVLNWDRMLAFGGNTALRLQYAHARIRSVVCRSGGGQPAGPCDATLADPAERTLAITLLGFAAVLDEVAETLQFHQLCRYLHELTTAFAGFYRTCPVLQSTGDVQPGRLVLCDLTARTLATGLGVLGIGAPDRVWETADGRPSVDTFAKADI